MFLFCFVTHYDGVEDWGQTQGLTNIKQNHYSIKSLDLFTEFLNN